MFSTDQYELLAVGGGRRWERFGEYVVERICPAAVTLKRPSKSSLPKRIDLTFASQGGKPKWQPHRANLKNWQVRHGVAAFRLKPTPAGQIGIFPEQAPNWDWLTQQVAIGAEARESAPLRVLNLFAYTGGSTLAAALGGANVTHIDAAPNVVQWARQNAKESNLENAPIRWICEDVMRFVSREVRRGNRYEGIILDPPSYGHGPKGEVWQFERDLPELLDNCVALLSDRATFMLLTAHTTGFGPSSAQSLLSRALGRSANHSVVSGELRLASSEGVSLDSGVFARWASLHSR